MTHPINKCCQKCINDGPNGYWCDDSDCACHAPPAQEKECECWRYDMGTDWHGHWCIKRPKATAPPPHDHIGEAIEEILWREFEVGPQVMIERISKDILSFLTRELRAQEERIMKEVSGISGAWKPGFEAGEEAFRVRVVALIERMKWRIEPKAGGTTKERVTEELKLTWNATLDDVLAGVRVLEE